MVSKVRRIVTGHDADGRAVFVGDERLEEGPLGAQIWSTAELPADNSDPTDGGRREIGIASPGGSAIRVMTIEPGHRSPMHRTQTIDYGVVIEGSIGLELDDGATKTVGPGEVVVQRGTIHAWVNSTDRPCRIAFIVLAALPLVAGGRLLEATHA